jgi:hypothetical protein
MLDEEDRNTYLLGQATLRDTHKNGRFTEYIIKYDTDSKGYQIRRWKEGKVRDEVIAEGLSGDEAWNFLKLIGG